MTGADMVNVVTNPRLAMRAAQIILLTALCPLNARLRIDPCRLTDSATGVCNPASASFERYSTSTMQCIPLVPAELDSIGVTILDQVLGIGAAENRDDACGVAQQPCEHDGTRLRIVLVSNFHQQLRCSLYL